MLRIVRVLAHNPGVYTLEGTNTWVVGEDPAAVIDPGPVDEAHLRMVRREAGPITAILVTHSHEDHAPGAAALSEASGAPVYAHDPLPGGIRIGDGHSVEVGGGSIVAVHTPGHSPDSVAFLVPGSGALFTGDSVLGRGTSVIDPPEGDLVAYLRSLRRMKELGARIIYPGHGPAVFNADAKLDEYLVHREMRERQILDALAGGATTVDGIVAVIYSGYPEELRPLAARSVLAHLQKLVAEGTANRSRRGGVERYERTDPRTCRRCGRPVKGRALLCSRCSLEALQERPG